MIEISSDTPIEIRYVNDETVEIDGILYQRIVDTEMGVYRKKKGRVFTSNLSKHQNPKH